MLEALAYSHQHGIVHRDIKPANVIITNSGAVKVMDFGIARALHGAQSTTMTQTGMVMGTPQYLSPEQALGKAVDHRSDLYATGCLLYELLALRPPFTGETPLSVVYQHVQDMPVPPSEVSDAVPPELDGLVMRSLAKDPDDRFQSAEEMRGLVQYALQMLQRAGRPHRHLEHRPGRHARRRPHPGDGHARARPSCRTPAARRHLAAADPARRRGGGNDGGFDGGHGGARGGGRGKVWLLAALAVIAIAAGVAFALDRGGNDDKGKARRHHERRRRPRRRTTKDAERDADGGATEPTGDRRLHGGTGDYTGPGPDRRRTPAQPSRPASPNEPTDGPTDVRRRTRGRRRPTAAATPTSRPDDGPTMTTPPDDGGEDAPTAGTPTGTRMTGPGRRRASGPDSGATRRCRAARPWARTPPLSPRTRRAPPRTPASTTPPAPTPPGTAGRRGGRRSW